MKKQWRFLERNKKEELIVDEISHESGIEGVKKLKLLRWIFEASGAPFYIYQDFMFGKLDQKLPDIVEGALVLKDRPAGD